LLCWLSCRASRGRSPRASGADPDVRAVCERRALRFGRRMLVEAAGVPSVRKLVELAEEERQDGAQPFFAL
jgi:hypothetical protein